MRHAHDVSRLPAGWSITRHHGTSGFPQSDDLLWDDEANFSVAASSSNRFRITFAELVDFDIDFGQSIVRAHESASLTEETLGHLLADQVTPRILSHEGSLVLHAAGLLTPTGAILLVGMSGSGKSTLATHLHRSGKTLLGDDAIVISQRGKAAEAKSVYPSLRLFPDSIGQLVDASSTLTSVASYTSKKNVLLDDAFAAAEPVPIRAAFLLIPSDSPPAAEPLGAADAAVGFLEHSFWLNPKDLGRTRKRMAQAAALAEVVPAFRLTFSHDYRGLSRVHDVIEQFLDASI